MYLGAPEILSLWECCRVKQDLRRFTRHNPGSRVGDIHRHKIPDALNLFVLNRRVADRLVGQSIRADPPPLPANL